MKRNRPQGIGKYQTHKFPVYTINSSDDEDDTSVFLRQVKKRNKPTATVTRESDLGEMDLGPSTTSRRHISEASASTPIKFLNSSSESAESTEPSPILPALIPLTQSHTKEHTKSIAKSGIRPLDFAASVGRRWSAFNDRRTSTVTSEDDARNRDINSALPVSDGFSDRHRRLTEHARRKLHERRTATVTRESDIGNQNRFKTFLDSRSTNHANMRQENQGLMEKDQRFSKENRRNSRDKRTATVTRESNIEDSNTFEPYSAANFISMLEKHCREMYGTDEDERSSHDIHTETATRDSDIGNSNSLELSFSEFKDTLREHERVTNEITRLTFGINGSPTATATLGNSIGNLGSNSAFHDVESTNFGSPPLQSSRAARNLRRSAAVAVSASNLVNAVEQQLRDYDGEPELIYEITDDESSNAESSNDESSNDESNGDESTIEESNGDESTIEESNGDESTIEESNGDESTIEESNEIESSDDKIIEDEDSDVNYEESKKGRFAWIRIAYIYRFPHIFRNGEGYIAARLVEDIFEDFFEHLHNDIHDHTFMTFYYATKIESKVLNEINTFHCENLFGEFPFGTYSQLLRLDDVIQLYEYLEFCYKKLIDGTHEDGSKCGFIRINKQTIVPYTLCKDKKYIPLFCFEGFPFDKLAPEVEILKDWDLAYLKFCCRVQGLRYEMIKDDLELEVITLENIRPYFSPFTVYEEGWIRDSDNKLLEGDNVPMEELEYSWVKL